MKLTIYCNNCGKKIETWSETRRFCSNKCSAEHRLKKLHQEPTHPIAKLANQYKDCDISKIPEEILVKFMKWGLYDFTKLLERNNLKEFCERYREFVEFNKLCKNCGRIYPATKRSGSKCPYPECQEYNSVRWANGVAKNKATKLKKWGDENYNNYEKQVQTMMERYGVRAPMQRQESKDKAKKTCQEKYKTDYPMQNESVKAKGRNTSIIKWGVPYPSQTEAVKNKMKNSLIKNYGVTHSNYIGMPHYEDFNADYISKNFIISGELQEAQVRDYFKFYDVKPVLKLLDAANIQYKRQPKGTRGQRDFFYQFLQIYNTTIEYEKVIKPCRVDGFISPENFTENLRENFKIPQNSKGLIIEYLGDYWHGKSNDNTLNEKCNKTAMQLYAETQERFKYLRNAGYFIIYQWESDYLTEGFNPKFFAGE